MSNLPTSNPPSSALLAPQVSSAAMRAIMSDRARLQRMLDFMATLARAQASLGVVPASAVDTIVYACRAEHYDAASLSHAAALSGDIAVPLIEAVIGEVSKSLPDAARYVNWGASSQDVVDSALVLELRAAIDALIADLDRAVTAFAALAGKHRRLPMAARILLRHARAMPFGLKLAGYAAALARSRERLRRLRKEVLVLQFGGTAGLLATLDNNALEVSQRLAALLDLALPDAPWHSHRDRLAEVAANFGILAGTCGKIARDVSLLMQTDVAEAFEPAKTASENSPTMPHQRYPVAASAALSAAAMAPNLVATIFAAQVQEHERSAGTWAAEWTSFPALALLTSGALAAIVDIAEGLEVDSERMRANLEASSGLAMSEAVFTALCGKIGYAEARTIINDLARKAIAEKQSLQQVLTADDRVSAHLSAAELANLFEPMAFQGAAQTFIDRQIATLVGRGTKRN